MTALDTILAQLTPLTWLFIVTTSACGIGWIMNRRAFNRAHAEAITSAKLVDDAEKGRAASGRVKDAEIKALQEQNGTLNASKTALTAQLSAATAEAAEKKSLADTYASDFDLSATENERLVADLKKSAKASAQANTRAESAEREVEALKAELADAKAKKVTKKKVTAKPAAKPEAKAPPKAAPVQRRRRRPVV